MKKINKVNKHHGVGRPISPRIHQNTEHLYCKNCKEIPAYTKHGQYFSETKWYEFWKYGELCDWIMCADCHTPLKVK